MSGPGEELGFDLDSAVDTIGAGLGLEELEGEGGSTAGELLEDPATERGGQPAGAPAPAPVAPPTTQPEDAPATQPAAAPAPPGAGTPQTDLSAAPKTWRAEAAAVWSSIPPAAQAEIAKREADIFSGIEGYKEDAAFGKSLRGALDPFMPILQQYGIDPARQVASLMQAHQTLALGTPEQKSALFQRLAADYGIQLPPAPDPSAEPPYIDPAVKGLQTEVERLKSERAQERQQQEQAARAETMAKIEAFVNDPANIYVQEVAKDMASLAKVDPKLSLREAYDKAIWLNPLTREKELARLQTGAQEKRAKEEADRVAAAKKATAAKVNVRDKGNSGTAPLGTLDDTLKSTYQAIVSRS